MSIVESVAQLESIYGTPGETSTVKVTQRLIREYRTIIEASPFLILATCGPEGLDCSPRGDRQTVVRVINDSTLHMPDRRGNNRVDSLRNIVRDPRVAMLFLIPGCGNTLRVNGRARITIDESVLQSFAVDGKRPRSVVEIRIDEVYFQCARAIVRSELWNPAKHFEPENLPSPGEILAVCSDQRVGGKAYDQEWPERARKSLW